MSDFINNRIIVRGMDNPTLKRSGEKIVNDFSIWAGEYEMANDQGLYSLSTTLLVPGESIPTYKPIGFIMDESKCNIRHISEQDSGSCGNEQNGDFRANSSSINSLDELENIIKQKHQNVMNEVNINISSDAIVGLFANMCSSNMTMINIILAQKYFMMQTGKELPIFMYDVKAGYLVPLNINENEKNQFIQQSIENKKIRTSSIYYETEKGEIKEEDFFDHEEEHYTSGHTL